MFIDCICTLHVRYVSDMDVASGEVVLQLNGSDLVGLFCRYCEPQPYIRWLK